VGALVAPPLLAGAVAVSWAVGGVLGVGLAAVGLVGDLFESLLKRSVGVKDSSTLIPGHGGVLDRVDSYLFAAPAYFVFLRYLA
jgi:phosphatidate cytidylyltransferase